MNFSTHLFPVGFAVLLTISPATVRADALDNWHLRNGVPAENLLSSIAYGHGIYVAVGSGGVLTSLDGTHWTTGPTNRDLTAIVFGASRFVAVGFGPSLVSTNGTGWLEGDRGLSNFSPANGLAYGNGIFVSAAAFGTVVPVFTSTDGLAWTRHDFSPGLGIVELVGAAYGNGIFLVIGIKFGAGPFAVSSTDGTNWALVDSCCPPAQIAFGNGFFAGVNGSGSIQSSPDGTNWTTHVSRNITNLFNGIGFANGVFGGVGKGGLIWTSSDSALWTPRTSGSSNDLYAFAGNDSSFIAIGDAGTILQSDDTRPRLTARAAAGAGVELSVTGGLLRSYRVQASDRLPATNWTDLLTFTSVAPATNFVDTSATNFNRRFYRVVSP